MLLKLKKTLYLLAVQIKSYRNTCLKNLVTDILAHYLPMKRTSVYFLTRSTLTRDSFFIRTELCLIFSTLAIHILDL